MNAILLWRQAFAKMHRVGSIVPVIVFAFAVLGRPQPT